MSATSERFQRSVTTDGSLCALHSVKLITDKAVQGLLTQVNKPNTLQRPTMLHLLPQLNQQSFRTKQTRLFQRPPLSQHQFCGIAILWPPHEFILAVDLIDKCRRSGSVHLEKFYRIKGAVSALKPTSEQLQDTDSSKLTFSHFSEFIHGYENTANAYWSNTGRDDCQLQGTFSLFCL